MVANLQVQSPSLPGGMQQPENTYSCILTVRDHAWEIQKGLRLTLLKADSPAHLPKSSSEELIL